MALPFRWPAGKGWLKWGAWGGWTGRLLRERSRTDLLREVFLGGRWGSIVL